MADIEILESLKSYTCKPEVVDKAINSLEAWDEVVKELEEWRNRLIEIVGTDAVHLKTDTIDEVLRIIKKHLSEAERKKND